MVKKKAAVLPLAGQTFAFVGKPSRGSLDEARGTITALGGQVQEEVTSQLNYLVVCSVKRRPSPAEKKADKHNLNGAKIAVLDEGPFWERCKPTAEQLVAFLKGGAEGVQIWAKVGRHWPEDSPVELRGVNLRGFDLSGVDFKGVALEDVNLQNAQLTRGNVPFAQNCNFNGANLQGTRLGNVANSSFRKSNLRQCDLRGVDLSSANLTNTDLAQAQFDEQTRFPSGFTLPTELTWVGKSADPRQAVTATPQGGTVSAAGQAAGSLTVQVFVSRLSGLVEFARLKKALQMLKADRFQLFAQAELDSVVGIVKSQTDRTLVYSCRLTSQGSFACCTQNLNPCGGLRGALCKHLLVLIVGLTKAGQLDPGMVEEWVKASSKQGPFLDRDVMSATFLRYQGAEAGEIDWRPTETIPEDYYAL